MRQIKTPIAGKAQSTRSAHGASFSQSIAKIGDAAMRRSELAHFNKQMLIHELIRGSLKRMLRSSVPECRFGVISEAGENDQLEVVAVVQ